ncbi:MAG TPA: hypothetical protein EYG49_03650 [Gammaproteobacteria bacterium]|nr:hypothetical protein [Gammaproteobacteria bacterium]
MNFFELIKQRDKQQHFFICLLLTLISIPFLGVLFSTLLTFFVGVSKETWDKYYGSGFCWYDMLANLYGWSLGLLLYGLFQWYQ